MYVTRRVSLTYYISSGSARGSRGRSDRVRRAHFGVPRVPIPMCAGSSKRAVNRSFTRVRQGNGAEPAPRPASANCRAQGPTWGRPEMNNPPPTPIATNSRTKWITTSTNGADPGPSSAGRHAEPLRSPMCGYMSRSRRFAASPPNNGFAQAAATGTASWVHRAEQVLRLTRFAAGPGWAGSS